MANQRPLLIPPLGEKKILMHSCCAPCSVDIIETLLESGLELTLFFYNPNIHPLKEYEIRKSENKRFAEKQGVPFVDADYDTDNWFERVQGLENEPERGKRCTVCFDMRFERTALYAMENNFPVFSSSLGISRWKNKDQINDSGTKAAKRYPSLTYWTYNWRKFGGSSRMYEVSKKENLYKQEYCGCIYSLRDTNLRRKTGNRTVIRFGKSFYKEEDEKGEKEKGEREGKQ